MDMTGRGDGASPVEDAWLDRVAQAAAAEAGVPAALLGEYLGMLADAALTGRRPDRRELTAVRHLGRQAAEQGVAAGRVVDLYLSAAWRLWHDIPIQVRNRNRDAVSAAAEAVLRVVDDAVAILVEAYQAERRHQVRREEAARRQFIDDLLRGDTDVARMVQRAEPFGLDLGRPHQVMLAAPGRWLADADTVAARLEHAVVDRFGDRDVLVADKNGQIVIVVPDETARAGGAQTGVAPASQGEVGGLLQAALRRTRAGVDWRVATGRGYPGAYGIARSYEEAREALTLAERLRLDAAVVHARDLLVYRVLGRDREAIMDLVQAVLGPLTRARGGPGPLLETLRVYFETGEVATETARRIHLSVRTVTYRLAKIAALTGHDPGDPADGFTLHAAVLGARLLSWPEHDLSLTD